MKNKPLKAGEFRATCNRSAWVIEQDVPVGWDLDTITSRWDKELEAATFLVPCTLDTTDRAEFERHMKDHHGGGLYEYEGTGLKAFPPHRKTYAPRFPIKLRSGPLTGAADGRPFKPSTKAIAATVEVCTSCGLVAEVDGTNGPELWWTEHQRGCALAAARAAS